MIVATGFESECQRNDPAGILRIQRTSRFRPRSSSGTSGPACSLSFESTPHAPAPISTTSISYLLTFHLTCRLRRTRRCDAATNVNCNPRTFCPGVLGFYYQSGSLAHSYCDCGHLSAISIHHMQPHEVRFPDSQLTERLQGLVRTH